MAVAFYPFGSMTLPSTPPFMEDFPHKKKQLHHHVWSATPAMFDDSRGKKKPSQHDFICRLENLLQKEKQVLHLQKRPPSRRALPYEILIYSICMYVYIYLYIA